MIIKFILTFFSKKNLGGGSKQAEYPQKRDHVTGAWYKLCGSISSSEYLDIWLKSFQYTI